MSNTKAMQRGKSGDSPRRHNRRSWARPQNTQLVLKRRGRTDSLQAPDPTDPLDGNGSLMRADPGLCNICHGRSKFQPAAGERNLNTSIDDRQPPPPAGSGPPHLEFRLLLKGRGLPTKKST